MEDKQYLDEAGLSEVGKVISKFYASKDEIKDLDSLKDFVSSHSEIKLHYITKEEYDKMREDDNLPLLVDKTDHRHNVFLGQAQPPITHPKGRHPTRYSYQWEALFQQ